MSARRGFIVRIAGILEEAAETPDLEELKAVDRRAATVPRWDGSTFLGVAGLGHTTRLTLEDVDPATGDAITLEATVTRTYRAPREPRPR